MKPTHFACIDPVSGVVVDVVAEESRSWCEKNLGGMWVEVTKETGPAGLGYTYEDGIFITPQPFPSWTLNKNNEWEPPIPRPPTFPILWNEKKGAWVTLK